MNRNHCSSRDSTISGEGREETDHRSLADGSCYWHVSPSYPNESSPMMSRRAVIPWEIGMMIFQPVVQQSSSRYRFTHSSENKYLEENRLEGKSYYLSSRRTTRNVVDTRRESTVELVCLVRFLVRLYLFGIAWRTDFEFIGAINIAGEKKGSTFSTISRNSTIDRSPRLFESVERFVSFSRSWNELDNEKIARTGIPTRISYFVILSSSNFHSIFSVDKIITSDWYSLVVTILLLRCKWLREKHHLIFNITRHIRFIDSFGICFRYLFIGRYIFARELYSTLIDLENHRFNWSNYLWTKYAREGWKKIDSKDKYNDECVVVSWSLSIETLNLGVGREWRTSKASFFLGGRYSRCTSENLNSSSFLGDRSAEKTRDRQIFFSIRPKIADKSPQPTLWNFSTSSPRTNLTTSARMSDFTLHK